MTRKSLRNPIERLKAAGYELSREQDGASFKFVISPVTTVKAGGGIGKLSLQFQRKVVERIRGRLFSSPLTAAVLFPKIMNPAIATWPDSMTYKRKEQAYFVSVNIPFRRWDSASFNERIDLLSENLITSLEKIPPRHLTKEDRLMVSDAIHAVQAEMKLRLAEPPSSPESIA